MTISQATLDAARAGGASSVGVIDVNNLGGSSLQLMFAKLQLILAESSKNSAMEYIRDIQKSQEEQKEVAAMLQEARQQQANAKSGIGDAEGDKNASMMSQEMQDYMDAHELAYDKEGTVLINTQLVSNLDSATLNQLRANGQTTKLVDGKLVIGDEVPDRRHNKDEWEVAITSLQARMDSLGTDTQQKMVYVQDFMGQYNSYLQGANSVIQQSNQTLAALAKAG
ncbi:MAG: hypothetical protein LBF93_00240 [Zoogloeaceae bacterium]|jgi:hypothetical protein|nr:hypothetical protein [Zoogloeaceae bacterium]